MYKGNYLEALEVLKSQPNPQLFYQLAPVLFTEVPRYTVRALVEQGRRLQPLRLLPALVGCRGEMHTTEAVRYLEHCVDKLGSHDRAVHNHLVALYAESGAHERLLEYLQAQGDEISMVIRKIISIVTWCLYIATET